MTWRFDNFEGNHRWIFENEEACVARVYGKFTSRGDPYFEADIQILEPSKTFLTFNEAVAYIKEQNADGVGD